MTAATASAAPPRASVPVLRALLDQALTKGYPGGVLGVRAEPAWDGPEEFVHADVPVRVVACRSTLAVREALLDRDPARWLVVLTDRDENDLGAGVLTHVVWHRLRIPDPWDGVRHRFAATGIDPSLVAGANHRELAGGLLTATPVVGWPPAPGGTLTRDHALGSVARAHLGLGEPGREVDVVAVLHWTTEPLASARVADLRNLAGDEVTDAVLRWAAAATGPASGPVQALLAGGHLADVVPLGLVVGLLSGSAGRSLTADDLQVGRMALVRLEPRVGGRIPGEAALRAWSVEAASLVAGLLLDTRHRADGERLVARADQLLGDLGAGPLAELSDLLRAGLTARLGRLADALRAAVAAPCPADLDLPLVAPDPLAAVERAWSAVAEHRLVDVDSRSAAFRAAVRLVRWLALPSPLTGPGLLPAVERHRDADAWVDAAVNDAASGVGDSDLGAALGDVLALVRQRRSAHDVAFAERLAAHTQADATDVPVVEDLLADRVLPLARQTPVLLLVLDGMSVSVAGEVLADVLSRPADGWVEAVPAGSRRRGVALAVLPTLTEHSRTSLLTGTLARGGQPQEQRGYAALTTAHGLPGAALFHKKPLDTSLPGQAVSGDVAAALDDTSGTPLVTCVLNAVDDALDRSDPGGTVWSIDAIKHLRPLLERARIAGRTVILTADHGHIVERRQGQQRSAPPISSGRSRSASPPAGEGEVLVRGRRVLDHGGEAVLAVDERLRYGPLKAGYHGGASPAEVLVPVCVLVAGDVPDASLQPAAPQEPPWWWSPIRSVEPAAVVSAPPAAAATLFDLEPAPAPPGPQAQAASRGERVAAAVLASATYRSQRRAADRVSITDDQVARLIAALLDADDARLGPQLAALALQQPTARLRGAVPQVQRLLNVESYPVLHWDADGVTLVLDTALLCEQFEVAL